MVLLSLFNGTLTLQAQTVTQQEEFDGFVSKSIALSEKLIYQADFEEAQKYVRLSFFETFTLYKRKHKIALISQDARVQIFKNRIYQNTPNQKKVLGQVLNMLTSARKLDDKAVYANYMYTLGMAYLYNSDRDSAGYYYREALKVYQEFGDDYSAAKARAWLTWVANSKLNSEGIAEKIIGLIPVYQEEIEFATKTGNKMALSYNTRHLANIYLYQLQDFDKALELYQYSLSLREGLGFRPYLPASYSSIGDVFSKKGDIEKAIEMYFKSIQKAEEIKFIRYLFHPRIKIGDIYQMEGKIEKAKTLYLEALKVASLNKYLTGIEEAIEKLSNLTD